MSGECSLLEGFVGGERCWDCDAVQRVHGRDLGAHRDLCGLREAYICR